MATELAKAYVQIIPSADGISGSITSLLSGEASSAGKTSGTTVGNGVLGSLKKVLTASAVTAAVKGLVDGISSCVSESMDFDSAMSQVAATMGTTVDQIQDLTDVAQEMGATTAFSATEAAEGLNILAMAGLDADEQIAALPTVLNLASAGALSLDSAASYVTGTIKGFGASMEDAEYYSDLMAKGATLANTNVNDLGEALSESAATASAYGQEADSVTLSLLRLAEQNVTGSEAATALNRAMADLYTPTDSAKTAMEELGVSCYDASGEARDFNDIVDDLDKALSGYDAETQNAYKDTIFTTQGLNAFNKMTTSSEETVNNFKDSLADCSGSAMQQAATQLDNLEGDLTLFSSAMSGLKTTVGEALTPALRDIVSFGTEAVSTFNDIISGNLSVSEVFDDLVSKVQENLGVEDWQGVGEKVKDFIIDGLRKIIEDIPATMKEIWTSIADTVQNTDWSQVGHDAMKLVLDGLKKIVVDIPGTVREIARNIMNNILEFDWSSVGHDLMTTVLTGIKLIVVDVPNAVHEFTQAAWDYITNIDWLELGSNIVQGIIDGILDFVPHAISAVGDLASGLLGGFKDFFGINSPSTVMKEQGEYMAEGVINGIESMPDDMMSVFSSALGNAVSWGSNMVSNLSGSASDALSNVNSYFTQLPGKILAQFNLASGNITSFGSGMVENLRNFSDSAISGAVGYFTEMPGKVMDQLNTVSSKASSWGSELTSSFKGMGKNVMQGLMNGMDSMVSSLYSSIKKSLSGLVDKAKNALGIHSPSTVFRDEIGAMVPAGMAEGIEDNMDEVESAVNDMMSATEETATVHIPEVEITESELGALQTALSASVDSGEIEMNETGMEDMLNRLDQVLGILEQYFPQFANTELVLDTGTLVGEMATPMDKALGRINAKKVRQS